MCKKYKAVYKHFENFSDLEKDIVDKLFIMSLTFGDVIKRKVLSSKKTSSIDVILLREFES